MVTALESANAASHMQWGRKRAFANGKAADLYAKLLVNVAVKRSNVLRLS